MPSELPASVTPTPTTPVVDLVDVRGPRFAAWATTTVLVAVLVVSIFSIPVALVLLAVQTVVFALGAALGPRRSPYGRLYAVLVAPLLGPVTEREPVAPLRFAQAVGFAFAAAGLVSYLSGAPTLGVVFVAFALFAALLNAAFGICLGCQIYPLVLRIRSGA
ncbi:MAG TPA: DUF4395 domain-containing protein [Aldersonia sp.]